jgi:hypothetical protein
MIKDQFLNGGRFENNCDCCGNYGHDLSNCRLVHYSVNK